MNTENTCAFYELLQNGYYSENLLIFIIAEYKIFTETVYEKGAGS